jgi:hypothetical protein
MCVYIYIYIYIYSIYIYTQLDTRIYHLIILVLVCDGLNDCLATRLEHAINDIEVLSNCMYACICMYVCMYACMFVCIGAYMFDPCVYTYVCVFVCINVYCLI